MIQAEHHSADPEAVPDHQPRRVTIDMLRHPSIRETVTRAAGIAAPPIRSIGVTRWTALTRRAVWPAARRQQALAHPREVAHADIYVLLAAGPAGRRAGRHT